MQNVLNRSFEYRKILFNRIYCGFKSPVPAGCHSNRCD